MRQPQHRNRARARTRRQPNPANKVYESNGPDVKVRGTPQQIADKYMQLGRDALSAGDAVKAENYFQHAEHYLRIIAAAQEQLQQRRAQQEQRRQEAAARRRANDSAQQARKDDEAPSTAEESRSAEVVMLPTEPTDTASNGDNTAPATETSWEDAPEFLTRPVEVADSGESTSPADSPADEGNTGNGNGEAAPRKTARRRMPRARKGNGSAAVAPQAAAQPQDSTPCAPTTPASSAEDAGKAD